MMAYNERYEWCSSSIPATLCPSNVNKSTQPCPLLSSSLASTSLISNTNHHSISISTDTISLLLSSVQEEKATHVLPSLLDHHLNDYYTKKRIEQLHERMDDIQIASFLKFINYHLSTKHEQNLVKDLGQDLSNGHVFIDLIEIFSSTKLKREHGRTRFHSLTNIQYVLDYLKLHMHHINISPHEIVSGNRKQILALLWIIMKIFDFPSFRLTTNKHLFNENTLFAYGQDRSILLKWLNNLLNKILNTKFCYIKDFYIQTWIDNSSYLLLIIKYLSPLSKKYSTSEYLTYSKELEEINLLDKKRLELCLNLSNYTFNTMAIVDYTDRTEKSLLKFFSELQQNILFILKTNHIGKLNISNPYTKQIVDAVLETTIIDPSEIINDDDDYLICTKDENRWNEKEDIQSDSRNMELLKQEQIEESKQDIVRVDESEQPIVQTETSQESAVSIESLLPPFSTTDIIQSSDIEVICQNPSIVSSNDELKMNEENLQNSNIPRSRKTKKKKTTLSIEKLASVVVPSRTANRDLLVKIIECLRDPKMSVFKYIFVLVCLCFSILIIFIQK